MISARRRLIGIYLLDTMARMGIEQVGHGLRNVQAAEAAKLLNAIVLPGALALALALAAMTAAGAQAQPNVEELLVRVGERVAEFYRRAKNVICIETSTVQVVDFNNSPVGFVRTVNRSCASKLTAVRPLAKPQSCAKSGK